jgi:branched-chain amino acid transport system ATP-binding protein
VKASPRSDGTADPGVEPRRPLLEVISVQAGYGLSRVLFDVTLRVDQGEVVALLGRNGAGKSTTLKAIMGIVAPTAGRVLFEGRDLSRLAPHRVAQSGLGYVPQERRIFPDLTVRENLDVGCRRGRRGTGTWTIDRVCELFPPLEPLLARRGQSLSGGEQQMLAIARTLLGNPRLLLLDEPTEGLAPRVVQALADQIVRLKADGVTIVLSEQNVHFTVHVCDRAYVLEKGHITHAGEMASLAQDRAVLARYLGV